MRISPRALSGAVILFFVCAQGPVARAGFGDFLDQVKKTLASEGSLSETQIVDGLKEALEIGTSKAVEKVSTPNGFYENPQIRIPLPGSVEKVKKLLVLAGYGPQVEAFELSMNRAAEQAAPKAKALFLDSSALVKWGRAKLTD